MVIPENLKVLASDWRTRVTTLSDNFGWLFWMTTSSDHFPSNVLHSTLVYVPMWYSSGWWSSTSYHSVASPPGCRPSVSIIHVNSVTAVVSQPSGHKHCPHRDEQSQRLLPERRVTSLRHIWKCTVEKSPCKLDRANKNRTCHNPLATTAVHVMTFKYLKLLSDHLKRSAEHLFLGCVNFKKLWCLFITKFQIPLNWLICISVFIGDSILIVLSALFVFW